MRRLFILLILIFFPSQSKASELYKLDPNHTNITWSANHFGFSSPSGKFSKADGTLILDSKNPQNSAINVTIETDSIFTGIQKFDNHLKSDSFFNVEKFPTATFISTKVTAQNNKAKVQGNLTLLGITKAITLDVRLNKIGINPYTQRKTAGFSAKTTIKRSEFGMNFAIPGVSDKVILRIEAEAILEPSDKTKNNININKPNSDSWNIISAESMISFKASQGNHNILGNFKKFDSNIIFNPDDLSNSKIEIIVDTNSVSLSSPDFTDTLKNKNWLSTLEFPKATFTTNKITKIDNNSYSASGKLTIKDKSIAININFKLEEYSQITGTATAIGSFKINRNSFNIGDPDIKKANNIKNEVTIKFKIKTQKP